MKRTLVAALAVMLLLAPVVPFVAVGSAAAAPAGMATIPDGNVAEDVPSGETIPLSASALEGGVLASEHANSLEVVLTTADHAPSVMDSDAAVVSGDGMALVLRDDQQSAGREVALDAGQLQEALGYRPEAIRGTHEDGSTWTASAEYVDGYLVFDVPHFSSNTVTFSGEVTIDASGATNGTQFQYSVGADQTITDEKLTLTGQTSAVWANQSWGGLSDGSSRSYTIGGNTEPTGPQNGNPVVTVTGSESTETESKSVSDVSSDTTTSVDVAGNAPPADGTVSIDVPSETTYNPVEDDGPGRGGTVHEYRFVGDDYQDEVVQGSALIKPETSGKITNLGPEIADPGARGDYGVKVDVYISQETEPDSDFTDGTLVKSGWDPNWISGRQYISLDTEYAVEAGESYVVQFVPQSSNYDGEPTTISLVMYGEDPGQFWYRYQDSNSDDNFERYPDMDVTIEPSVSGLSVSDNTGTSVNIGSVSAGGFESANFDIEDSTSQVEFTADSWSGPADLEVQYTETTVTDSPSVDIDGDGVNEIDHTGTLPDGSELSTELSGFDRGDKTASVSLDTSSVGSGAPPMGADVSLAVQEQTKTVDPAIEIASGNGTQTLGYTGTLNDGETVDLSNSLNTSAIGGDTTLTTTLTPSTSGPPATVGLNYSHSAQDKISTNYQASTFEESYNISHTYADATENAQATIPFTSSRVVGVNNVEYRVDGGSWSRVASANYRLDGTTLDVYLDDATGGVEAGQTVDVRATGRKISVGNGAVTVTDPTAPGEELDTQLQIDSRSEGFHVNVGPTDDGDRVHYAYADNFPTEDYVVIDAAGNQQLYLPNSVQGDRFRVQHLDTRVVAEQGDVRIDVVEAGQDPELDVSPGPGGSGDPVTVEYYNTESGVTYLLNSLTRSIVVDSDTAQSPAIFEDDDSEDTWAILQDSGPSGTSGSGSGGIGGQFRETASGAVGAISLPVSGSGLGQLALVGVLGLGGVVVLRRLWPFGDDSEAVTRDTATASGSGSGHLSGLAMRATGLVGSLGSVGGRAARASSRGLLTGLQGLLGYLGNVVSIILGNRRASIAATVIAAIVAARVGLVQLPEGTGILIVVSGVPLATWLIMRRSDAVSRRVWLASTIAAVILGLEFVAPGTVQTAIEQLTSEQVAPLLILVVAGGLYLWYRARQSDRPQIIIGGNNE